MSAADDVLEANRRVYAALDRMLVDRGLGGEALFLNWGYASDADACADSTSVRPPAGVPQARQWRLVLEALAGRTAIDGADVLDVGCGRGGALTVLARHYAPRSLSGLDLSAANIEHCRRLAMFEQVKLQVGDACRLPHRPRSFDVVLNVESASGYPDFQRFIRHVHRVLRPDGVFVYADLIPAGCLGELDDVLAASGFVVTYDRDVTSNVLAARRADAAVETAFFQDVGGASSELSAFLDHYRAGPGSGLHRAMTRGDVRYCIVHARRSGHARDQPVVAPCLDARPATLRRLGEETAAP